jgi:dihydrofolate reductase
MPWPKIKEDMQRFVKLTTGRTVVMGRKTWEASDMPSPLPNRHNIVVTRSPSFKAVGADVVTSIDDIPPNSIIIGGAGLLVAALPRISTIFLTVVSGKYPCDTYINLQDIFDTFTTTTELSTPTYRLITCNRI